MSSDVKRGSSSHRDKNYTSKATQWSVIQVISYWAVFLNSHATTSSMTKYSLKASGSGWVQRLDRKLMQSPFNFNYLLTFQKYYCLTKLEFHSPNNALASDLCWLCWNGPHDASYLFSCPSNVTCLNVVRPNDLPGCGWYIVWNK